MGGAWGVDLKLNEPDTMDREECPLGTDKSVCKVSAAVRSCHELGRCHLQGSHETRRGSPAKPAPIGLSAVPVLLRPTAIVLAAHGRHLPPCIELSRLSSRPQG